MSIVRDLLLLKNNDGKYSSIRNYRICVGKIIKIIETTCAYRVVRRWYTGRRVF